MARPEILLVGLHHFYQWRESSHPNPVEHEQRQMFTRRVRQIIQEFQPNIIADETPDSDNPELLALLPMSLVHVDIPQAKKKDRSFNIERSIHYLCPYVDAVRERYWRYRLYHLIKGHTNSRVLMFIGAKHLQESYVKPIAFPDLLRQAGYSVDAVDLYEESGWDHSWIHDWVHPTTPITGTNEAQCCVRSGTYQRDNRCSRKKYWNGGSPQAAHDGGRQTVNGTLG